MNDASEPRPGRLLIAASWFIIVESAFWFSAALAILFDRSGTASVFAYMGAFPFMAISSVVLVSQYFAVFRRSKAHSEAASGIVLAIGAAWFFAAITTLAESMMKDFNADILWLVAAIAIHGLLVAVAGYITRVWYLKLRRLPADCRKPSHSQFSVFEALGAMTLVAVIIGFATMLVRGELPQTAEHVSADRAPIQLPEGASDISYARGVYNAINIEFSIDEETFSKWLGERAAGRKQAATKLEISPSAFSHDVVRYGRRTSSSHDPETASVSNGFSWELFGEEWSEHAYFDRDAMRAYFSASHD